MTLLQLELRKREALRLSYMVAVNLCLVIGILVSKRYVQNCFKII